MTKQSESVVDIIKTWLFPGLAVLVGTMMWNTLNEIKADVKVLMSQSAIDKTRIDNLERIVYSKGTSSTNVPGEERFPPSPYNMIAIVPPREEIIGLKPKKRHI